MSATLRARGTGVASHEERAERNTGAVVATLERLAGHLQSAAEAVRELARELDIQLAAPPEPSLMSPVDTRAPGPELLTVDHLADLLHVSTKTIRRWRNEGRLPDAIEIAGVLRWRAADVDRWLKEATS